MSDLLIKNMDMPKENTYILLSPEDGLVCEKIGSMYHVTTSFVEVKTHGRLIDADAMRSDFEAIAQDFPEVSKLLLGIVDRTPTEVEANNGRTD